MGTYFCCLTKRTLGNKDLHNAVKKLAGEIPGAFTYIFDVETYDFIYKSEENESIENEVKNLKLEDGLIPLANGSDKEVIQLDCQTTGKKFLLKQMAVGMFFGMCVEQKEQVVKKAEKIMVTAF